MVAHAKFVFSQAFAFYCNESNLPPSVYDA
jgi:hypothetical protein